MSLPRIESEVRAALAALGVADVEPHFERPRDPSHGDWATNVALTLAGRLRKPPRAIAEALAQTLRTRLEGDAPDAPGGEIAAIEVAGPGFLNFRLAADAVLSVVSDIIKSDSNFGRSVSGAFEAVSHGDPGSVPGSPAGPLMVEFVSANPTGLLHLGHGRQAALGDVIASLLAWTGREVYREFYYNDAGRQIERLAESVRARYLQHFGREAPVPDDGYHAQTVVEIAAEVAEADGDRWLDPADAGQEEAAMERFRTHAVARLREEQDRDLSDFRVRFDRYYLESSLYDEGRVEKTIADLRATGLVYDHEGAVWLRTTEFGDQKDRVMVKSDGSPTYFLPDVAYHVTKWERGFREAINVQGADHHGTTARVHAGLRALGLPEGFPEYVLHQMVTVERGGVEVKFSKRAGDYVTLRDLVEEVGTDVTRYFFLMRKPEAHLVFDLDWAMDQSDKNPVYKAQYAHARMCSILRKAGADASPPDPEGLILGRLVDPGERDLIRKLSTLPEALERAARARAPHLVCEWLEQTAGEVNAWYHAGNPARNPELAVLSDDPELRAARVALTWAVRIALRNALTVLGISAPEAMHREESTVEADASLDAGAA
jgi:arginyl-tRNA synthetase